jgi:hypothetical protein
MQRTCANIEKGENFAPDIHPAAGDLIEVTLHPNGAGAASAAQVMLAKIKSKSENGKWQIELAGLPPMQGLVSIGDYVWSPTLGRWTRKEQTRYESPAKMVDHKRNHHASRND